MNTGTFFEVIKKKAWDFDKITPAEMGGIKLMDRIDVKDVILIQKMPEILEKHSNIIPY